MNKLFIFFLSGLLINNVYAYGANGLNFWVNSHLEKGDFLVCQRELNNDYFFVARSGKKLKIGYRLDVTASERIRNKYAISWSFKNKNGNQIGLNIPPVEISKKLYRIGKYAYAEDISYYYVPDISKPFGIEVGLKKFGSEPYMEKNTTPNDLLIVVKCNEEIE